MDDFRKGFRLAMGAILALIIVIFLALLTRETIAFWQQSSSLENSKMAGPLIGPAPK